jgi:PAS domain S-box-containing protein
MRVVEPKDPVLSYAAVLDALPIVAFMLKPEGELAYLSRAWQAFTGFSAEEGLAHQPTLVHPDDRDRAAATWAATLTSGSGYRAEFRLRLADDSYRWVLAQTDPVRASDGSITCWLGTLTDLTEIMRAHRALAQSEEHYRLIGEALPGVAWSADADGGLNHMTNPMNASPEAIAGGLGHGWLDSVHPDDRERTRARWRQSVETGEPYEAQFRVQMPDGGEYRWLLARARAHRDESGTVDRWVGVNVDIDAQKRADEAREQFVRLVEASDDCISYGDPAGHTLYINAAGRRMLEVGTLEDACRKTMWDYFLAGDLPFVQESVLPTLLQEGRWSGELALRNQRTGDPVPMWHNMFTLLDEAGKISALATVSRDLRERRRVEVGMRTLAEAGAAIYGSLDFENTMRNVAEAVARSFAAFCIVEALTETGQIRSVAAVHRDPSLIPLIERAAELRNMHPAHPIWQAMRDGKTTLVEVMPATWWDTYGVRPELGSQMDALDMRSVIYVPIRSQEDGSIRGAMTCVMDGADSRGAYTPEDVRFAEEVAVRAGLAFDHARAYERERRIAVTLQGASLPKTLPTIDHLYLSADYRPGKSEATIGGDWYDAFLLDDGRVAITVGDVVGNGLEAAVTMGRLRQAMRAIATVLAEPNALLDVADRTLKSESSETYATALAGVFDPRTHEFTFASAGHPSPVLRHPDGRIEELRSTGMMLGMRRGARLQSVTIEVPPGSTLVFFTDGLTEATRDVDEGYRRLFAAMSDDVSAAADNPARALVEHVLAGGPSSDDIAVLVAEVGPSPRFDERLRSAAAVAASAEQVHVAPTLT